MGLNKMETYHGLVEVHGFSLLRAHEFSPVAVSARVMDRVAGSAEVTAAYDTG